MEENLDDAFLAAENLWRIKWCIFHDFNLRLGQTPGLEGIDVTQGIDFNRPPGLPALCGGFCSLCPQILWPSPIPEHPGPAGGPTSGPPGTSRAIWREAVARAREAAAQEGYDLYLVGDEINEAWFDPAHAALFDAHTNFTLFDRGPGLDPMGPCGARRPRPWRGVFQRWSQKIAGLTVAGRGNQPVVLQPGFAPQYDDRLFHDSIGGDSIWVLAENQDQVKAMAQAAHDHAQPVDQEGNQAGLDQPPGTTGPRPPPWSPTAALGPKYPGGNYQFDMVDAVREVFGHQTFRALSRLGLGQGKSPARAAPKGVGG